MITRLPLATANKVIKAYSVAVVSLKLVSIFILKGTFWWPLCLYPILPQLVGWLGQGEGFKLDILNWLGR